jgi:hypothetical protein
MNAREEEKLMRSDADHHADMVASKVEGERWKATSDTGIDLDDFCMVNADELVEEFDRLLPSPSGDPQRSV